MTIPPEVLIERAHNLSNWRIRFGLGERSPSGEPIFEDWLTTAGKHWIFRHMTLDIRLLESIFEALGLDTNGIYDLVNAAALDGGKRGLDQIALELGILEPDPAIESPLTQLARQAE